jgi:hypothetical protein
MACYQNPIPPLVLVIRHGQVQRGFGAHKSGRYGHCRQAVFVQLLRHGVRESADRNFDQVVEKRLAIIQRVTVADFDDKPTASLGLPRSLAARRTGW